MYEHLFRQWQHKLRLDDWKLSYTEVTEFNDSEAEGLTKHTSLNFKSADIYIKIQLAHEMEVTIVHELLHIHFPFDFTGNSLDHTLLEQGIELTARALVGENNDH